MILINSTEVIRKAKYPINTIFKLYYELSSINKML